ncbi:MAG: XisI protein, partial [Okeania sp. SIO3B3]|nr:XisI protein [Okeania sp. SIO3B3]
MAIDYSQIIQTLIKEQASLHKSGDVRVETIFDTKHH